MRNTFGVSNARPVLSAFAESVCVCLTVSVSLRAVVSYAAVTTKRGCPASYTHWLQNQSRFSPVASSTA